MAGLPRKADPALVAALLAAILLVWNVYDQPTFVDAALHADMLMPAQFFWDLAHHHGAWHDFALPRVPSLVPDLALYGGLMALLGGQWRIAHLLYGAASLGFLALLAGWVLRGISNAPRRIGVTAFLLVALPVLAVELLVGAPSESGLHGWIFLPVSHGGSFLLALTLLILCQIFIERPHWSGGLAIGALTALGLASDKLFALAGLLPALTAILLIGVTQPGRRRMLAGLAILLTGGTALGMLLDRAILLALHRQRDIFSVLLAWPDLAAHLRAFAASPIMPIGREAPLTALCGQALPLVGFALAWPHKKPDGLAPRFWWIVAVTASAATACATAAVYNHAMLYRYAESLLWWPIIMTALHLIRLQQRRPALFRGLAYAMALLSVGITAAAGFHRPRLLTYRDPLVTCLLSLQQRDGLQAGLAEYDYAAYLSAMSDWRLQIEQISGPSGRRFRQMNDPYWYDHQRWDRAQRPVFNFILATGRPDDGALTDIAAHAGIDSRGSWSDANPYARFVYIDRSAIESVYGAPDQILSCPDGTSFMRRRATTIPLWVYHDGVAVTDRLLALPMVE